MPTPPKPFASKSPKNLEKPETQGLTAQQAKQAYRRWAKAVRRTLDFNTLSQQVVKQLAGQALFQQAGTVLTYWPLEKGTSRELDLRALMQAHPEKQWLLPRMQPQQQLSLHRWAWGEPLEADPHFGVQQPQAETPTWKDFEGMGNWKLLVLVPALVCSGQGQRLGYGQGYYDRLLQRLKQQAKEQGRKLQSCGVVPSALLVETLPQEAKDERLTHVATEWGLRAVKPVENR